ncbi:MAG TPA: indole-3-glycerol phosphate synthase TrpC [Phycisphaerales bacterium]|nr:indole-3-glycerol phosphate synthase TrpC [Phycisphaerales bacterium]
MPSAALKEAIERKRAEVARARGTLPFAELEAQVLQADPPRNLFAAVTQHRTMAHISVIAELRRAEADGSLVRAEFAADGPGAYAPAELARRYHAAGAAALSVVTDPAQRGSLAHLEAVRHAVPIPVLRRDLIIDPWQLWETRAAGADGVLLTAEALPEATLLDLLILSQQLGLTTLLLAHSIESLLRVRPHVGFPHRAYALLGISNRDPESGTEDLGHTLRLMDLVEDPGVLVSEGGIRGRDDLLTLRRLGVRIVLVGTELLRRADPAAALAELLAPRVR